jgi:hypothetical protein
MDNLSKPCVPLVSALSLHEQNEVEVLAFVCIDHDNVERRDDGSFKRTVEGRVEKPGEQWRPFVEQAQKLGGLVRFAIFADGGVYENLLMETNDDRIRLEMTESFHGTADAYRAQLMQRCRQTTEKWQQRMAGQ